MESAANRQKREDTLKPYKPQKHYFACAILSIDHLKRALEAYKAHNKPLCLGIPRILPGEKRGNNTREVHYLTYSPAATELSGSLICTWGGTIEDAPKGNLTPL